MKRLARAAGLFGCVMMLGVLSWGCKGEKSSEPVKVHKVQLNWNAAAKATSYKVYRRPYRGGDFVLLGSSDSAKYEDAAAMGGERYCYRVTSVDAKGREGVPSKEWCLTVPRP